MPAYFLKVVLFVTMFLLLFVYIGFSIPQSDSKPPAAFEFDVAEIKTKQDLVKVGQKVFYGKGKCALCHTIGDDSGRCPNLEFKGGQLTRGFLYESLTQPSKYIYMDYRFSPPKPFAAKMPVINKPPIGLNENEVLAVIAFLQNVGGGEVTVEPSELIMPVTRVSGDAGAGKQIFVKTGCAKCHAVSTAGIGTGRDLTVAVQGKDEGALRQVIFYAPPGQGAKPSPHRGLDQRLSVKDANDLLAFLLAQKVTAAE
jgi:mono/diheme cytochrome c family protein